MTYELKFELEGLPGLPNKMRMRHWRIQSKHNREWRNRTAFSIPFHQRPKEPLQVAVVKLTRYSTKAPDSDGLVASFKPILDGFQDAQVLADDSYAVVGMPHYEWKRALKNRGRVEIEVEG